MPKNTTPHQQFIGWSYDDEEQQTFVDIVKARSSEQAEAKIARKRPYATLDLYVKPMLLTEYIIYLQKVAKGGK